MAAVTTYETTLGEHTVELVFDQRLVVLNRARLMVDGEQVDTAKVVYGTEDLHTTLADGTEIAIRLHSGLVGELTRAQIRQPDGSWADLSTTS